MWDINTFYYDSTSLMKNLAQSCFSGPCPDHVYLSLVVIGAELKEEIYVWHTSHRRTDTVFTHLIEKPAVLTSVSPRAKNEHRNPIINGVYATIQVNGCTKHDRLNIIGCRLVTRAGWVDRWNRAIPSGLNGPRVKIAFLILHPDFPGTNELNNM